MTRVREKSVNLDPEAYDYLTECVHIMYLLKSTPPSADPPEDSGPGSGEANKWFIRSSKPRPVFAVFLMRFSGRYGFGPRRCRHWNN